VTRFLAGKALKTRVCITLRCVLNSGIHRTIQQNFSRSHFFKLRTLSHYLSTDLHLHFWKYFIGKCPTYQCDKQMVKDKVNGNKGSQRLLGPQHRLIHDLDPRFLSENLEHRHECLQENGCPLDWQVRLSFFLKTVRVALPLEKSQTWWSRKGSKTAAWRCSMRWWAGTWWKW